MSKFLEKAFSFIGTQEHDPRHKKMIKEYNELKPLPQNYHVAENDSWCAVFVSYIALLCKYEVFPYECSVMRLVDKCEKLGITLSKTPHENDLIIYGNYAGHYNHVGIVANIIGNDFIATIEGNYCNKVTSRTLKLDDKKIMGYLNISRLIS